MTDHTFGGVLDWHYAVVAAAGLHLTENTADVVRGERIDGVPEVLESGAFGERTLGTQVCDGERLLQCPAGGHNLLENA